MTPFTPQLHQSAEVHISDYLRIIMFRRRTFLLAFLMVFLGTALYTLTVKPIYEAFATLQVQTPRGGKGDLMAELGGNAQNPIDTEIEIIKSRTVSEQVLKRLPQATPKGAAPLTDAAMAAAANSLKSNVKAVEVGNKTGIVRISYQSTDPGKACEVVNTLSQVYRERNISFRSMEASKTLEFIGEQLTSVKKDLDDSEIKLQQYRSSTGAVKLDADSTELVRKLADYDGQLKNISLHKRQLEYNITALREAIRKGTVYTPTFSLKDDAGNSAAAGKLAELDVQRKTLLSELSEGHPQIKVLKAQIDEIQAKLLSTYEADLKGLIRHESNVKQVLGGYDAEFRKLPEAERDLGRLLRLTKVNADIYNFLLHKHEEARIAKAATISNISVIDPAITPVKPIKPNKKKNLLLGLLIGLMVGVGLAFFHDYMDDTIKDSAAARRVFGLPLLAIIPFITRSAHDKGAADVALISHYEPKSPAAEAFRSLRTSIHFSSLKKEKNTLLVTSTFPGEGKSTIASNLAITLAQTGARVLLIDCDMRRPSVHEKYGCSRVPGLSEVLAGDVAVAAAVHGSDIPNLFLLSAGTIPPNPSELLGSKEMERLITELKGDYGQIVIDAPPLLAVTDASVLTSFCDLLLLVIEPGRIPEKIAVRVGEILVNTQAPVAGLVISDRESIDASYGYYYSKYGYRYGYASAAYQESEGTKEVRSWWRRLLLALLPPKRNR
jgi:tyrosine-protein kinase Etk/Wzc